MKHKYIDIAENVNTEFIMPHKTPDSCLVMEWLPEGLKRSLKRKKPPTLVGGGSFLQYQLNKLLGGTLKMIESIV